MNSANRSIMQLRSFVVVGYQSLVAYVASSAVNGTQAANIYLGLLIAGVQGQPYYTLISIYLPIILYLWLGRFEGSFLFIAQWSLLGWVANTMVAPAYFLYLALGNTIWPVISQFVIGILNVVAGCVLGAIIGGNGVIIGAALALTVGSGVVAVAFCREYKLDVRDLLPRESRHLMALCALCLVLAAIGARAVHALQLDVRCYVAIALLLTIPVGVGAWPTSSELCRPTCWRWPWPEQLATRLRHGAGNLRSATLGTGYIKVNVCIPRQSRE